MSDTFRQNYKVLNGEVKDTIYIFKHIAENLEREFDVASLGDIDKRCMALAKTNLEQSIMWAIKAIT